MCVMAMVTVMVSMLLRFARCRAGQVQIARDFRRQNRLGMVVVVVASEVTQLVIVIVKGQRAPDQPRRL